MGAKLCAIYSTLYYPGPTTDTFLKVGITRVMMTHKGGATKMHSILSEIRWVLNFITVAYFLH